MGWALVDLTKSHWPPEGPIRNYVNKSAFDVDPLTKDNESQEEFRHTKIKA